MKLNIPVGVSDFEELRKRDYYYVDKTGLIFDLLKNSAAKVTLLTRPRRFGKTLAMSMLESFLDIRRNSRELFDGLQIMNRTEICEKWMNQYPVLFLSLKDVEGTSFENAFGLLKFVISQICITHSYLKKSDRVSNAYKEIFIRLEDQTASFTDIQSALLVLTKMMQEYYKKPVILLMDEYDVPVAAASSYGYYDKMLEVIRVIMSSALKDNQALLFAVITGCLKITKESIFTGTNNFVSDSISSARLDEYFGFTGNDVKRLLESADLEKYGERIQSWYDGYHFGDVDVYCPWDVMNYVRDLQFDPDARPVSYWKNTSSNSIIRSFIDFAGNSITRKLETLMEGGYITEKIEEDLTYDYLHSSEENLWSVLYLTGYLTKVRESELKAFPRENRTALSIPNAEIREIFETTIVNWFDDSVKKWNRQKLFEAVWTGNAAQLEEEMNRLLRKTISYHDYREDFYHAFLAGIFTGVGYMVESNKEHGEGRSDVVVFDPVNSCAAVFEAKYSRNLNDMKNSCEKALFQINEKMYAKEFEDDYDHIFCYGISFFKKRCMVGIK